MRARHLPAQEFEVLQRDRGFGDADIVCHRVERVDCALRLAHGSVDLAIGGRAVDPVRQQLDRCPQRVALRAGRTALAGGVHQEKLGLPGPAGLGEGNPQIGQQVQAARIRLRQQHGGAAEEIAARDEVERGERVQPCRREQLAGAQRERGRMRVPNRELLAQAQRALEVARAPIR